MSWDDQLKGFMANKCMKQGGIFDHHGNTITATPGFTPSVQEVKGVRDAIVSRETSVTEAGIVLNNEPYAVLVLDSEGMMALLKSKDKKSQEPLSVCVAVCPTVVLIGISDDGGVRGAGANSVMSIAEYLKGTTQQ